MEQIKQDDLKKIRELDHGKTIKVNFIKKHDTLKQQYEGNPETKYTAEFSKKDGGIYSYKIIKENNKPVERENVDFIIVSSSVSGERVDSIAKLKEQLKKYEEDE